MPSDLLGGGLQYKYLPYKAHIPSLKNQAISGIRKVLDDIRAGLDRGEGVDSTTKLVNHKILTRLIKNQAFIVVMPKSIFLQP